MLSALGVDHKHVKGGHEVWKAVDRIRCLHVPAGQ